MPTFLHAADLHLDSPLRGLERKEGAPASRIRNASREAMEQMVNAAIDKQVAFVLLAGDIYDTEPSFETYLFFHKQMVRLEEAGIPVAIVLGNHDHAGVSPRAERLPGNVHVFADDKPGSLEVVPGVWVHGQSYPSRDIQTDLTENYPSAVSAALNIGLLHTALDGHSGEHARYAPSSTERLAHHGYDYWALGHVHAQTILREGRCHIVYPGNLQGRHARETGAKGAMFVKYDSGAILGVEHQAFDDVRWYRVEVDAADLAGTDVPLQLLADRVRSETEETRNGGRLAAVRLCVAGAAPASLMALGEDEIRESLHAVFSGRNDLFLEKIELDLYPEAHDRRELDEYLDDVLTQMGSEPEVAEVLGRQRGAFRNDLRKAGGELVDPLKGRYVDVAATLAAALPLVRQALLATGRGKR